jgi:hypothetical protein
MAALAAYLGVRRTREGTMPINLDSLVALDKPSQVGTLLAFAWNLTVAAREAYVPGSLEIASPAILRGVNEAMHQVLQHAQHVLEAKQGEYPDDGLADVLAEMARQTGIGRQLDWAWARAVRQ